jgi:hypothetical protein
MQKQKKFNLLIFSKHLNRIDKKNFVTNRYGALLYLNVKIVKKLFFFFIAKRDDRKIRGPDSAKSHGYMWRLMKGINSTLYITFKHGKAS